MPVKAPEEVPPSEAPERRSFELLHLSCVIGAPVIGPAGDRLGRTVDLIVRLDGATYPPLSGVVANIGGRELFVPIDQVDGISVECVRLKAATLSLDRFERRRSEVLLGKDLARRHVIYMEAARLVRANEIELACVDGRWAVIGIDTSSRSSLRHFFPRFMRGRIKGGQVIDWSQIEPFVGHVPTARLRIPFRRLSRLHPALIADLVEAASHDEGEEIIQAVGQDRELEADVFEELDVEHQVEFLNSRSDAEAARVLARMAPDDAADLIVELEQDRRLSILQLLPGPAQRKVRRLLSYNPETAGGLMSTDFVEVPASRRVGQVLDAVRGSTTPPEAVAVVYLSDADGRLVGTALLADLVRADADEPVAEVSRPDPIALPPDADVHEIVRKMTDFNLALVPVTDADDRMIGQITVDDVLELLLPSGWRREYGMSAPD
ncbi:MAG TPA: CBS domain-containing protein [Acidimicrobiales bacterium]|nr:CBS domain-containing protein [Acidimicrobiales bacterium]